MPEWTKACIGINLTTLVCPPSTMRKTLARVVVVILVWCAESHPSSVQFRICLTIKSISDVSFVRTHVASILFCFVSYPKPTIFGISLLAVSSVQLYPKNAVWRGDSVQVVVSKPEFFGQVAKAYSILYPRSSKALLVWTGTSLNHSPPTSICGLVTVHVYDPLTIWVDFINAILIRSQGFQLLTASHCTWNKRNIIWDLLLKGNYRKFKCSSLLFSHELPTSAVLFAIHSFIILSTFTREHPGIPTRVNTCSTILT